MFLTPLVLPANDTLLVLLVANACFWYFWYGEVRVVNYSLKPLSGVSRDPYHQMEGERLLEGLPAVEDGGDGHPLVSQRGEGAYAEISRAGSQETRGDDAEEDEQLQFSRYASGCVHGDWRQTPHAVIQRWLRQRCGLGIRRLYMLAVTLLHFAVLVGLPAVAISANCVRYGKILSDDGILYSNIISRRDVYLSFMLLSQISTATLIMYVLAEFRLFVSRFAQHKPAKVRRLRHWIAILEMIVRSGVLPWTLLAFGIPVAAFPRSISDEFDLWMGQFFSAVHRIFTTIVFVSIGAGSLVYCAYIEQDAADLSPREDAAWRQCACRVMPSAAVGVAAGMFFWWMGEGEQMGEGVLWYIGQWMALGSEFLLLSGTCVFGCAGFWQAMGQLDLEESDGFSHEYKKRI